MRATLTLIKEYGLRLLAEADKSEGSNPGECERHEKFIKLWPFPIKCTLTYLINVHARLFFFLDFSKSSLVQQSAYQYNLVKTDICRFYSHSPFSWNGSRFVRAENEERQDAGPITKEEREHTEKIDIQRWSLPQKRTTTDSTDIGSEKQRMHVGRAMRI